MRQMNEQNVIRLEKRHRVKHCVPGMIDSIDYMHIGWNIFPIRWKCQIAGKLGKPTIVMETVTDYDLYLWLCSIGVFGLYSDINIWDSILLYKTLINGSMDSIDFQYLLNSKTFKLCVSSDRWHLSKIARFVQNMSEPIFSGEKCM